MLPQTKVFSDDLKTLRDSACLISIGKESQSCGAFDKRALSPMDFNRVCRTIKRPASKERRSHAGV